MTEGSGGTKVFASIDEFCAAEGTLIGASEWFTIDQERINAFADVTEDWQWIHVDPVRAASGPYGAPIAHGYLTLSLIPRLGGAIFRVEGSDMQVNYGLNKARFPQAVTAGASIRAVATLLSTQRTAAGIQAVIQYTIEIKGQNKPACVAETVRLLVT
ncbi:MaoC family dehydratase [Georgenia ruanii]|uniref:Dehydratase n=1 Tax=Georgenia ruanii TaxID=348442 RepID=A0A7J9UVS6_9MICO|nr:MaoC family dehydratase [Georgenia ruanii]MPV88473.1 dehydratase [Georgenia ruanii]